MRKINTLLYLFLFMSSGLLAQPFTYQTSLIEGLGRSYMSWGDFDNDGDLDLAACGEISIEEYATIIYENQEGTFVDYEANLLDVREGSLEWGDFDNDNDLDLLLSGETYNDSSVIVIYRNDDGVFVEYDHALPGTAYGHASWGDFDNDGDLDIMLAGSWDTRLYENNDGDFIDSGNEFIALQNAKTCWGDFDNDGDQDILLIGDTGGALFSDIYLNDDNTYARANLPLEGLFSGSADLVDFDNDGDLDISLTGFDMYFDPRFTLYENLGDGSVTPYYTSMEGIAVSAVDWGDYDNDGDLDVIMAGKNASCGSSLAKVYRNDDGYFVTESGAQLSGLIRCGAAWADYDNDGDLDFILSGMDLTEKPYSRLYRNSAGTNEYAVNTPPEPPAMLETLIDGQNVTFSWEKATDLETPQDGLYYNIYLGMQSGDHELISPLANTTDGYRFVQSIGNTNMQNSWTISNLRQGTYFWSVQTIDQSYCGSEFAQEGSFVILETGVDDIEEGFISSVYPNPAADRIIVHLKEQGAFDLNILNTSGQVVKTGSVTSGDAIDISELKEGVYFLQLSGSSKVSVQRIVKR